MVEALGTITVLGPVAELVSAIGLAEVTVLTAAGNSKDLAAVGMTAKTTPFAQRPVCLRRDDKGADPLATWKGH